MIHSRFFNPWAFPWNSTRAPEQINRSQDIGGDLTLNREKQYEIGREEVLDYKHGIPTLSYTMRQFENGAMELWYDFANRENPGSGDPHYVVLDDLQSKLTDIAAFLVDDSNTFEGTIWFPKLRVSGFTLNIASPDAIVEKNFTLTGEKYRIINDNYLAYQTATVTGSGSFTKTMTLSPIAIQLALNQYIYRVLRIRAGVVTELIEDESLSPAVDTFGYNSSTHVLSVQTCQNGDVIKAYYPSATAYTTTWVDNNVEASFLMAESCEVNMKVGTSERIYRLQSVGIDVKFDRTDYREIGNSEYVTFGVRSKTVTVSLNRYSETFTLEDILANDTSYPDIDPTNFSDDIQFQVKIYTDKTHTAFKIGYLITKCSPTAMTTAQAVQDYNTRTTTLQGDNLKISDLESEIAFI